MKGNFWHNARLVLLGMGIAVLSQLAVRGIAVRFDRTVPDPIAVSRITWVSDPALVSSALAEDGRENRRTDLGLSKSDLADGTCTVWAPVPKGKDDYDALVTLGHEALHCFSGQFHNQ